MPGGSDCRTVALKRRRLRFALSSASPCYNAHMTDKPATTPPREPLVLPANGRDVTAGKIGTVIGIGQLHLFRPYGTTADFSCGDNVITYIGIEQYTVPV
jgi:hypothetical protein